MKRAVHVIDPWTGLPWCGILPGPFFAHPTAVFVPSGVPGEIPYCKNCKRTRKYRELLRKRGSP